MLFNSVEFIVFFPIVVTLFFITPHRYRWGILLLASYIFYMSWKPAYILLIILSTLIDYYASLKMEKCKFQKHKRKYLLLSLITNLGLLFTFKYLNFFNYTLARFINIFGTNYVPRYFNIILPMGISFYTFQTLSYTIDVYKGKRKPEKHFGIFALYVSFFPQLVAGPIERSEKLIPQFYEKHKFNYNNAKNGLILMMWGFFKKVVIADRAAIIVGKVYTNPTYYTGLALIYATVFFAIQIYCDFSGYSDIAIGCAKIMGFNLTTNFKRPYFSKSIKEFWNRWHITLSSWLKDYVYIPLGGSRVSIPRYYLNIFITFALSGLWHGANWTFIIWGILHSFYLIIGHFTYTIRKKFTKLIMLDKLPKLHNLIKVIITLCLVCFAWIFFVSNSMHNALYVIKHLFTNISFSPSYFINQVLCLGLDKYELIIIFISIIILLIVELLQRKESIRERLTKKPAFVRWTVYIALTILVIWFRYSNTNQFIYFQF